MEGAADLIALGSVWFVAFLFSTTLHEASHALVSWKLGDPTAYHGGQVSLSPVPHVRREPFGMVVVPLLSFALGGWMFGWASAPFDPSWAARHPRRSGAMALAGPVANLLLVVVSAALIRVGIALGAFRYPSALTLQQVVEASQPGVLAGLATLVSVFFSLNLILFLFNLFPLPPMDGGTVLQLVLPEDAGRRWQELIHQPMLAIVGILVAWRLFEYVFYPVFELGLRLLYPEIVFSPQG